MGEQSTSAPCTLLQRADTLQQAFEQVRARGACLRARRLRSSISRHKNPRCAHGCPFGLRPSRLVPPLSRSRCCDPRNTPPRRTHNPCPTKVCPPMLGVQIPWRSGLPSAVRGGSHAFAVAVGAWAPPPAASSGASDKTITTTAAEAIVESKNRFLT